MTDWALVPRGGCGRPQAGHSPVGVSSSCPAAPHRKSCRVAGLSQVSQRADGILVPVVGKKNHSKPWWQPERRSQPHSFNTATTSTAWVWLKKLGTENVTSLWDKQKGQSEPLDKQFVESSVKVEVLIMLILLSVTLVPVRLVAVVLPSWAKSIVSPEPKPDPMASPEEPLTFISCSTSSDKDLLLPVLEWRSFEEMTGVLTVTLLFQSTVEFWSQFFTNPWIPLATSMISDPTSAIFSSLLVIPPTEVSLSTVGAFVTGELFHQKALRGPTYRINRRDKHQLNLIFAHTLFLLLPESFRTCYQACLAKVVKPTLQCKMSYLFLLLAHCNRGRESEGVFSLI